MNTVNTSPGEKELRALVQETLKRDATVLQLGDDLVRDLGLDSMTGLRLLAVVETRFGVRFPDDRLSELRSLEKILRAIDQQKESSP